MGVGDAAASELVALARAAPRRPRCARSPRRRGRGSSRCHRGSPASNRSSPPMSTAADGRSGSSTIRTDQRRRPLVWRDDAGTLLVVGAAGLGHHHALASVVVAAAPSSAAIYVVDARGDAALDVLGCPASVCRRRRPARCASGAVGSSGASPTSWHGVAAAAVAVRCSSPSTGCRPAVGTGHARRRGRARRLGAPHRRGGGGRHPLRGDRRAAGRAVAVGCWRRSPSDGCSTSTMPPTRPPSGCGPRSCRAALPGRARRRLQRARGPARRARSGVAERRRAAVDRPSSRSARSPRSCTRPHCRCRAVVDGGVRARRRDRLPHARHRRR